MDIKEVVTDIQHAYQKNKSTQTALFQFINKIYNILEDELSPLGVFLDLSKAYDTIDHDVLLNKLNLYGIRGTSLQWIKSYLHNREQQVLIKVDIRKIVSEGIKVKMGIPQGSVLGPVLFILYVNDIKSITIDETWCHISTYADDTNILVQGQTISDLKYRTAEVFNVSKEWFTKNKLIINPEKTNLVLFKTNKANLNAPETLNIGDIPVTMSKTVKFLGLLVDDTLSWSEHVEFVCHKLARTMYSLRILKKYIDQGTLKIFYHAAFESHVRYGIVMYGRCSTIQKIFIMQKRTLRIMLGMKARDSCRGKFRSNNILTVYAIHIHTRMCFIFKKERISVLSVGTSDCLPYTLLLL
nr:unnamed protein product [Callosobruchus analis]